MMHDDTKSEIIQIDAHFSAIAFEQLCYNTLV